MAEGAEIEERDPDRRRGEAARQTSRKRVENQDHRTRAHDARGHEHAGVLMAAGIVSAGAMVLVLYALARRLAGGLAATAVGVAFLYLCAFGHYYFNHIFTWVLPYT